MIVNLTQHQASPDQISAGVVDLAGAERAALIDALTFDAVPSAIDIIERAIDIAELACHNGLGHVEGDDPLPRQAMIGGALWLMAPLAIELQARGVDPVFAFSVRETVETTQADGSVRKTAVFRHAGWVVAVSLARD